MLICDHWLLALPRRAATYVQGAVERLVKEGHEVPVYATDIREIEHLWTTGERHPPPGKEVIREVQVVRFPVLRLPFSPRSYRAMQRATLVLSRLPPPVVEVRGDARA